HAEIFNGVLSEADVAVDIADGTLRASYDGLLSHVDPAIPFDDPRFAASLNGSGRMTAVVRDLLTRTTTLADYEVQGSLSLTGSEVRGFAVERGELAAVLGNGTLTVTRAEMSGPEIAGSASGTLGIAEGTQSDITYDLTHIDLSRVRSLTGLELSGILATKGRIAGPPDALHAVGDASLREFDGYNVHALDLGGHYDVVARPGGFARATVRVEGRGSFLSIAGEDLSQAEGTITFDDRRLGVDLTLTQREGRSGTIAGSAVLAPEGRAATLLDVTIGLGSVPWRLVAAQPVPTLSWDD